ACHRSGWCRSDPRLDRVDDRRARLSGACSVVSAARTRTMRRAHLLAIVLTAPLFGCAEKLDSSCPSCEVPTNADELEVFLSAGEYLDFEAESAVHEGAGP